MAPGAIAASPPASTLRVFAAASLSDAFGEIAQSFERSHAGTRVQLNLAGSQQLASQIEQGATADVFASADERWMDDVRAQQLLAGPDTVFALSRLVAIVPRTNPARISRLQDLGKRGVKLVLGARTVPVGQYSRIVLANLSKLPDFDSDYARRALANLVSEEDNVKAVVAKVQLGEADAGMVYQSDVTSAVARYVRVFEIPAAANVLARYPMAIVSGTRSPDAARDFVALTLSPAGQEILKRHGFIPVPHPAP